MPRKAESRSSCGRGLRRLAAWLIRGDAARFILADLDDALAGDLERGVPPWRARLRMSANIFASALSVARSWQWSPAPLFVELVQSSRTLARDLAFSLPALISMTLTIGATTAVFGVVDAVVLRPLPYPDGERIRSVHVSYAARAQQFGLSAARVAALAAEEGLFTSLGWNRDAAMTLTGRDEPLDLNGYRIGPDMFVTLGAEPLLGGGFAERARRGERVAYLHEGLWRQEFGADPTIVGQRIQVDDLPTTVVGVISAKQAFPADADIWLPLLLESIPDNELHSGNMTVLVRLAPGVTDAELARRLDRITENIHTQYPGSYPDSAMRAITLRELVVDGADELLVVLLGAVTLLFVLGSANVANLVLVRNRRQRVMVATRAALGGSRAMIVRWLMTELVILGGLAAIGGTLLAANLAPALLRLTQIVGPGMDVRVMDPRTLGFAILVTLLGSLAVAILPALAATRMDLSSVLRSGGLRASAGRRARRSQGLLIAGQAALGVVLIVIATQTLGELQRLRTRDEGFRAQGVLSVQTRAPESRYAARVQFEQLFRTLREAVAEMPGIDAAGGTSHLPIGQARASFSISIEDLPPDDPNHMEAAHGYVVLPGYLETVQVPLVAGRLFDDSDTPDAEPVAMVSRSFAEHYWPGESVLGKRLKRRTYTSPFPWITIVGVVEDVHNDGIEGAPKQAFYMPHGQTATSFSRRMFFVVRSKRPLDQIAAEVRSRIADVDPDLPIAEIAELDQVLRDSRATRRLASVMIAVFAAVGLTLLATGTYGVVAFAVAQRRGELGLRCALGAEGSSIVRLVLRANLGYLAAGTVLGLAVAAAISRAVDPGVLPPAAPAQFAIAGALLIVVGLASSLPPALRASRLDPVSSLRSGLR